MRQLTLRVCMVLAAIFLGNAGHFASPAYSEDPDDDGQTSLSQPLSAVELSSALQPAPPPSAPRTPLPVLPETEVMAEPQGGQQPQGVPAAAQPQFVPPAQTTNEYPIPSILQGTIFSSDPTTGYNADNSTVGSIINSPNLTYPGTINTVTSQVIRDQQVINFTDALRDIGGAVAAEGANGTLLQDSFFMRGLEVTTQNYRKDGFLDPTFVARDPANIARIDVLKGPSSVLYGAAQPAGTINLVTKRAMLDPYYWGGITFGSYGLQRYAFDVNSPLFGNKSLLFRLNGAYTDTNSFRQSVFNERTFIAPTLTWVIDDRTSLTWAGEYEYNRFRMDQGTIAVNGNPFAISRNTFLGDPNGDVANYRSYRSTLTLTRILNDTWTANIGSSSLFYNTPSTTTFPDFSTSVNPSGFITSPVVYRDQTVANPFREQNQDMIANLAGDFYTGEIHHKALIGTEFDWFITNHDTFTSSTGGSFGPINASLPGPFPVIPPGFNPANIYNVFDDPSFRQNRQGFYLQDMMEYGKFKLLAGSRFDWLQQEYGRSDSVYDGAPPPTGIFLPAYSTPELRTVDNFYHFSPKVGITYEAIPDVLTYYGTYSQSFTPSVGVINFTPVPLNPQIGNIYEGGIKTKILPNLLATVGGFHITQTNVNTEIVNPLAGMPGQPFYITSQVGLQRTQGVEMNLTGNITDRWTTVTNWTFNDARGYSIDPTINDKRPRGVPMYNANIWTRYNFVQEDKHTIGAALGMVYVGSRLGDYTSPLELPAYTRWDSGVYYTLGRFTAMLYWENMFNIDYVTISISQYSIFRGAPSNVRVQMSLVW
jgi:iron complex outermembrane receptor protein